MTDKTKTELAAIIGGMTASQIKKLSHLELVAMFGAMPATEAFDANADTRADDTPPTPDQMLRDESNAFRIDPDDLPVTDNSSWLTPTDQDVVDMLATLTPAEQHLLSAFAHCDSNVTNGAPKNATGPIDLDTWVWLEVRKVGVMTTPQKKGVLSSLVKKGLVSVAQDSEGDMLGWSPIGFEVVQSLLDDALPPMLAKNVVKAKAPKATPTARRKLNADGILFAPADTQNDLNRPGFTGGQNSWRIARYGTDIKEEDIEAVFS